MGIFGAVYSCLRDICHGGAGGIGGTMGGNAGTTMGVLVACLQSVGADKQSPIQSLDGMILLKS